MALQRPSHLGLQLLNVASDSAAAAAAAAAAEAIPLITSEIRYMLGQMELVYLQILVTLRVICRSWCARTVAHHNHRHWRWVSGIADCDVHRTTVSIIRTGSRC